MLSVLKDGHKQSEEEDRTRKALTVITATGQTSRIDPKGLSTVARSPPRPAREAFQPGASVSHQLGSCSAPPVCYQHAQMSADSRVRTEVELREQRLMLHEGSVWRSTQPVIYI